ncbi:HEAT repeat domain-containing protein [Sphingomonas sp. BK235]|uniref:HEAT repeat domain-containing protein n=1 Tax=Sphingomonas sp. BK235 TaxID=2512131 RepID=UPI00105306BD|nr:HEAT repeat domain-containing protein [Sphingomonas sp. BK235]TCP29656.1 HEAT repeat protein [Sphingomonas sp. BK235]
MALIKTSRPDPARASAAAPALDALVAQLASPVAAERRAAVRALDAHPDGIAPLCARLAAEPAPSVREAMLAALVRRAAPAAVTALLPLLRDGSPAQRNAALEALALMPDLVAPHVAALLRDRDSDVRIFTVNLLGVLPHPEAARWLVEALDDAHPNVCAAAVDGLAEIGDARALPALAALPARFPEDGFLAFAVQLACQRIAQ